MKLSNETIYVRLIDGTEVWVPVSCYLMEQDQYQIDLDDEYSDIGPMMLYEFYPGDIVRAEVQRRKDLGSDSIETILCAIEPISHCNWPDRRLKDFQFKACVGAISIDQDSLITYHKEIDLIIEQMSKGEYIYPMIIQILKKLKAIN